MKHLLIAIAFFTIASQSFSQTVYNDDQVIKISDYIFELEKKDSALRAELATIDKSMLSTGDESTSSQFVTVCGKITGLNKTQFPITDINLQLVKENGEVVTEKTTNNGYFSFKNISPTENYTFKLGEEETKTIKATKIIITDCNGKIVNTISKNGNGLFEYKVMDVEKAQLNEVGDGSSKDPVMKIKTLKENYKKLQNEVAESKNCKGDFDDLKAKFDELEKKYNELKASGISTANGSLNDSAGDDLLSDPTKYSQYLKNVHFEVNNSKLDEKGFIALDEAIKQMQKAPKVKFKIVGHADNSGTDSTNVALSRNRAFAIKNYIISKGVAASRISCEWFGSTKPITSNDTEEGKSQNRRVEIRVKE